MLEKKGVFGSNNMGPYGNSKLANMYCAYSLSKRLRASGHTGVHTYVLDPGVVKTELHNNVTGIMRVLQPIFHAIMAIEPEEGAENILYCALSNKCADETGLMYRCNGLWGGAMEKAVDDTLAERLWEMSEKA